MKHFRRSLRYLWPQRRRLIASGFCVMMISLLWAGGFLPLLPGLKILINPEGFHGWAYRTMAQARLGARLQAIDISIRNHPPARHIQLLEGDKDGPALEAGLLPTQWLVNIDPAGAETPLEPANVLFRRLAEAESDEPAVLVVFDQRSGEIFRREVALGEADIKSRLLVSLARIIPEPADFPGRFPILLTILLITLAINLLRDVFRFAQQYLVQTAVFRAIMDIRCENYEVVLHLPTTYFSEKGTSDTMSRFIQDTTAIADGQVTLFGKTLTEPAKALSSLAIALLLSWKLTLLAMVIGPPAFLLIRKFGKTMRRASRRALENWSAMLAVLSETLTGIHIVKAYTMEGAERKRFFRVNRALYRQQKKMSKIDAATSPSVEAMGVTAGLAAVAIAGWMVLHRQMDAEIFIAWLALLAGMFDPIRKLAKVITRFHKSDAAAKRVFELTDQPQETFIPNAPALPRHSESIEFADVRFRYPSAAEDALKEINLSIAARQTIAIVGPNGSGKTTLLRLLPRLIDPAEGRVLIDGHDISQCSIRSLRRQIGVVTQETILFHATIAENIAYGLRRPKSEDVLAAARKAFVDEFVQQMPDGYDTMVGEHGATLSGGQRQRIAIARAILRDPAILIFDEAMSQVDSDSEHRIQQAMSEFIKGRTTLMVAHRFQTVLSADRLVVMDAGRIIDVGTHAELMGRCQLYRHLYNTQFLESKDTPA